MVMVSDDNITTQDEKGARAPERKKMPTSDLSNIAPILRFIIPLRPARVLDLGAGLGKYGVLLREYLDGRFGNFLPSEWQVTIDGVEGFSRYWNLAYLAYNSVEIANFADRYKTYRGYDVVLMIDSLEHVFKKDAIEILYTLQSQNRYVIVSVPQGEWPQGAVHGNDLECHRATWTADDLVELGGRLLQAGPEFSCAIAVFEGVAALRLAA